MQTTVMTIYKRVSQSGPSAITDTQGATQQKGKRGAMNSKGARGSHEVIIF